MTEVMVKGLQRTIDECNECLSLGNLIGAEETQRFIVDTYSNIIPNLTSSLSNYSGMGLYNDNFVVDWLGDMKVLKKKLEFFLDTEGGFSVNPKVTGKSGNGIIINNTTGIHGSGNSTNSNINNNTVNNTIDIKAELSKVREKIEADEMLDDDSKEEINAKLNEIESVIVEDPTNNEKWKKLKNVVNWVTTKGYKIGEMILPILTKAMFPKQQ
ncbi:hypothetical protein [Clostridium estertheticum]|uniref:hypothetical protein n=1 Tax=Clostridium estertheticum TaxID=238834 RepID=UPI001C7D86C0|nr:hypothetical protein [Clostridium estertheticum]MBX4272208.1 hypothetical protein [Clostridium estertheticum]WLC82427.1 hypothetical protein KTC98_24180 [Clostridium estertheticum]